VPDWTTSAGTAIWLVLIALFIIDEVVAHSFGFCITSLGKCSPEWFRTFDFMAHMVSTFVLQSLLNALQRQQTLLRLLGAGLAVTSGLSLLLCGVVSDVRMQHLLSFLAQITPPPKICCFVIFLRKYGIFLGHTIALLHLVLSLLASHDPGFISLAVAMGLGGVAAAVGAVLLVIDWWAGYESFLTDCRVLLLFPGTSSAAQKKAMGLMTQMVVMMPRHKDQHGGVKQATPTSFQAALQCVVGVPRILSFFPRVFR